LKYETKLQYGNSKWDDELTEENKINYMNGNIGYNLRSGFTTSKGTT